MKIDREPRVVLDDAIDLLDRLAFRPELDRAELQALHEDVGGVAARHAADIDPMHIDREKADQRLGRGPGIDRRVHHRVVEMLALHGGVIADDDIAFDEAARGHRS